MKRRTETPLNGTEDARRDAGGSPQGMKFTTRTRSYEGQCEESGRRTRTVDRSAGNRPSV
eukprot:31147-Pelagococcus_subviridis.AAC.4